MLLETDVDIITAIGTLTEREREIMRLVSEGFTNAKIADVLCLSMHTAKNHKENIKRKLRICSCNDLLPFAIKHSSIGRLKKKVKKIKNNKVKNSKILLLIISKLVKFSHCF